MHLIVDGYGSDVGRLSSLDVVKRFLTDTPDAIGMKRISPVYVCQYQGENDEQCGVSGFVIIAESHLAVHTWPERGMLWVDVFSCRDFDADKVQLAIMAAFDLKAIEVETLPRGLEIESLVEPVGAMDS